MADKPFIIENLDWDSESEQEFQMEEPNVAVRTISHEDVIEKAKLEEIIMKKEQDYLDNFIRNCQSPEEGRRIMDELYYTAQKTTGYHVDVWPPKTVTTILQAEKVADVLGDDRLHLLRNKIDMFSTRAVHDLERQDDSFTIVVPDAQEARTIRGSEAFEGFQCVTFLGNPDGSMHYSVGPEHQSGKRLYIVSADMVPGNFIQSNLIILHGFKDPELFKATVAEITRKAREYKQATSISVPLNNYDKPAIIECAATLLGARGEQITDRFLDFVQEVCWVGKPNERDLFRTWETSVKEDNLAKDAEVAKDIGIRVEFWWTLEENLKKVQAAVQPANENIDESERPWDNFQENMNA